MSEKQDEWRRARRELVDAVDGQGLTRELGELVAQQLGGIKAMERMTAYIRYVKPKTAEMVVDEMLSICSDIGEWRKKKEAEEANVAYNELLDRQIYADYEDDADD